jgi:hypothetical protein
MIRILPWHMVPRAILFSVTVDVQERVTAVFLRVNGEQNVVMCVTQ